MLTLFSIPKPFVGHIRTIQYNALKSWTRLGPQVRVVLFGDEAGAAEISRELGIEHVPEIRRNDHGTPLVSDVFSKARARAGNDMLCYVNADIILMEDFLRSLKIVRERKKSFLMVGQRWDIEQNEPIDFSEGWDERLRSKVRTNGTLHAETGIDYFAHSPDLFRSIPEFAVGRSAWDNWLIFHARASRAAVVDASRMVMAVHQNHDYAHVPQGEYGAWKGPEAVRNLELAGGYAHCFTILDSNWILTKSGLVPAFSAKHLRRRPEAWVILHDRLYRFLKSLKDRRIQKTLPPTSH